jgi:quercetin dioxygenase-like cupin family protein
MRILVTLACSMWAMSPASVFGQDPVKVDPAHHKVELENADVRVLRITFGPGETAPLHDHPNSVAVIISDATNRLTSPGQKPNETPRRRGDVVMLEAGKHAVENTGKTRSEVVLVELKRPGSASYKGMALDPVKLAAKNYVVAGENSHARAIRLRSAVGDPSVLHEHPSNVVVRLNDSKTAKAGTVSWAPGPEKHGGDPKTVAEPNDLVIVELKSGAGASAPK